MTEAERDLWVQAQTDYSHAVAISAKIWGDAKHAGDPVPYEVIQAGAATCLIHATKLREGSHRAVAQPSAAPVAVKRESLVTSQALVAAPPCPNCGGPMKDVRAEKRTDKSPDYLCAQANGQCGKPSKDGKKWFPTGRWPEKDATPALAPASSRGLHEVPIALGDANEDDLPF